jgi:hypothetical protein
MTIHDIHDILDIMTIHDIHDILDIVDAYSNIDHCYSELFASLCEMFNVDQETEDE